jgi:hypothetical protein
MPRRGVNLTEEQWRDIKTRAAARGMTISEYIGQLAAVKPTPTSELVEASLKVTQDMIDRPIAEAQLHEVSLVPDTQANRDAGSGTIRRITPAPKPAKRKK